VFALKRNLTDGSFAGKPVRTNSLGYRDRELPRRKPANAFRVVAVGDSVTFGHGVDVQDTWPDQLEHRLAARFPSRRIDVINTAVPGNAPFQEYVDLERSLALEPDAAVIQFVLNDVVGPLNLFRRYGGKGLDYHGVEDVPYWDWLLSQHSGVYLLLKDVSARVRFGSLTREGARQNAVRREAEFAWQAAAEESNDPVLVDAWRECLAWLQREVDLCKRHGIAVVLIATPCDFQFTDASKTYAQRRLAAFAASNDIPYVDLLVPLRARATAEILARAPDEAGADPSGLAARHPAEWRAFWERHFLDYDHMTAAGHALVAEVLEPLIASLPATRKGS
jgi:lysophospholipase L1-like esterase